MEAEKAITINPYSLTSYYVDILFNDKKLSNATCFFTQQNEKIYLVTNWHVVSGRNADTNVVMSPTGGVPNKLRVYVPNKAPIPLLVLMMIFTWMLTCSTKMTTDYGMKSKKMGG